MNLGTSVKWSWWREAWQTFFLLSDFSFCLSPARNGAWVRAGGETEWLCQPCGNREGLTTTATKIYVSNYSTKWMLHKQMWKFPILLKSAQLGSKRGFPAKALRTDGTGQHCRRMGFLQFSLFIARTSGERRCATRWRPCTTAFRLFLPLMELQPYNRVLLPTMSAN